MHDLLITGIERFDSTSESAPVTLESDGGQAVAFCFPCDYEAGTRVPNRLYVLDAPKLQSPYFDDWGDAEKALVSREWLRRIQGYSYVCVRPSHLESGRRTGNDGVHQELD